MTTIFDILNISGCRTADKFIHGPVGFYMYLVSVSSLCLKRAPCIQGNQINHASRDWPAAGLMQRVMETPRRNEGNIHPDLYLTSNVID